MCVNNSINNTLTYLSYSFSEMIGSFPFILISMGNLNFFQNSLAEKYPLTLKAFEWIIKKNSNT